VRSIRSSSNPNSHFMHTLKALEAEILSASFTYNSQWTAAQLHQQLHALVPGVKERLSNNKTHLSPIPTAPPLVQSEQEETTATKSSSLTTIVKSYSQLLTGSALLSVVVSVLVKRLAEFFTTSN
jgi:hypothetical protein